LDPFTVNTHAKGYGANEYSNAASVLCHFLYDFEERLCSISMRRFLGYLLSLANTESPISCMKREYNVEQWFMVWQYLIILCVPPFISFSSLNIHWKY